MITAHICAGEISMASLKYLICCSLILATEAILCSASIVCGQTSAVKPNPTGSISGRVTLNGSAIEGIPVVAVSGQTVNRRDAAARSCGQNSHHRTDNEWETTERM